MWLPEERAHVIKIGNVDWLFRFYVSVEHTTQPDVPHRHNPKPASIVDVAISKHRRRFHAVRLALSCDWNFNNRTQGFKLLRVLSDNLIVKVTQVLCMDANHERIGQFFLGREVTSAQACVVVNVENGIAQRLAHK